ncbi:hypothetical protein [Echinicola vietnamensis]|uniref:Uncharacterized protein n=1 Tax=Echinicola vietnamensis (strain DSM 17526 / LMG 23754 / KMM 6221) TaxID=926556 RepID=L0FS03_ECHVK|nr:hypothetical protein [Echinicola vietnamensis]AGA76719.1 hypothetical protein Echvi_0433 [Echinicola vietnamensis DSM 17526]
MSLLIPKIIKKKKSKKTNSPELGSAIVKIAHKLSSKRSGSQVVKIGDKYYRIKELG